MKEFIERYIKGYSAMRHEQKAKSLAFSLVFITFPAIIFINILFSFIPNQFLIEQSSNFTYAPEQLQEFYSKLTIDILNNNLILNIFIILIIFLTISTNIRNLMEITDDLYLVTVARKLWKKVLISILLFISIIFLAIFIGLILYLGQLLRIIIEDNLMNNLFIVDIIDQILRIKYLLTILVLFAMFSITYKILPHVKVSYISILPGVILSTVGFMIASYYYEVYLSNLNTYDIIYGSSAKYLLFLLWFYILSQIIVSSIRLNAQIYNFQKDQ